VKKKAVEKKVKVRILPKVSVYGYGTQNYYPGDIVEIDEHHFQAGFMELIEKPKKPKKPKVVEEPKEEPEPTEETSVVEEVTSEVLAARTAPKVRKRKS